MTTITIELSDDMARRLAERAEAWRKPVDEVVQAMIASGLDEEEAADAYAPTPEEAAALDRAEADITSGRWRDHADVMASARTIRRHG